MAKSILIVDDMKLNIDLLTSILSQDYAIMVAISGQDAVKLLQRKTPDLVLLDISMPDMDGFEVLHYIKQQERLANVPVIFVTGEQDEEMEEKGLLMGAVDYVRKPYNASVVRIKVRNHLELKAYRDGLEDLVRERTRQLAASREAIIMGMSLMSESHDEVTGSHLERIKYYTRALCQKMAEAYPELMDKELAEQIELFSPLHDVGKVTIPDAVLKKTGLLTPQEFDIMKLHTLKGAVLLRKTELFLLDNREEGNLDVAIAIAECHHERFDGSGYPHGLKGEHIPLAARVVSVADVYDALRNPRPYKNAFSHEEALDIMLSGDGRTSPSHFDPCVLEVFCMLGDKMRSIYE